MSYRSSYKAVPQRPVYANASGTDLFVGFGSLALIGLFIALLATGYPTLFALLNSLGSISWPGAVHDIAINAACGALGGFAIGWVRIYRKSRGEVLEELIGATASPDLVSAARVNVTAMAMHVGAGLCAGLLVGAMGTAAPTEWTDHVLSPAGPLLLALGGAGGDGGGMPADIWGLLSSLLAFMIVVCAATILVSIAVNGLLATAAQSALTGAAQGWGQAMGTSFILAGTRLWTSRLSWQALAAREAPPLSLDAAIQEYAGSEEHTRHLIDRYLGWLTDAGHPLTLESAAKHFYDWAHFLESRGRGRPPQAVSLFHLHIDGEIRKRNPSEWFVEPNGVPQYDGSPRTLLYRGWFRRALRTGAVAGAAASIFQTGIVSLAIGCLNR